MIRDDILARCPLDFAEVCLVCDPDGLWFTSHADELAQALGYSVRAAADSFALRTIYERLGDGGHARTIILYAGAYIPYDIGRKLPVVNIAYEQFFPKLHAQTLRNYGCCNWELLNLACRALTKQMGSHETRRVCNDLMWEPVFVRSLCAAYRAACDALLAGEMSPAKWFRIADSAGFILFASHQGLCADDDEAWMDALQERFSAWMKQGYAYLSGTPSKEQPYLLHQTLDYIRRHSAKPALVVMDGMSFADFHMISRALYRDGLRARYTGVFSFVPSITSVARQSLFSGQLPLDHDKPFSLQNEEKQWRAYWQSFGYAGQEVYFGKTETPALSQYTKAAGIVINVVDDMMHSELQGGEGLHKSLALWLKGGALPGLVRMLRDKGFTVFITADHGNTEACAQGRFIKPGIITENASRRAAIYQDFSGAEELEKFSVSAYTGTYMPKGYRYFTFAPRACFGDKGKRYVSHGGMNLEELIVPFVTIGEEANG